MRVHNKYYFTVLFVYHFSSSLLNYIKKNFNGQSGRILKIDFSEVLRYYKQYKRHDQYKSRINKHKFCFTGKVW